MLPKLYMTAGTDMSDTIVVAKIAILRSFVPDRIAPLRNIRLLLFVKPFFDFLRNALLLYQKVLVD